MRPQSKNYITRKTYITFEANSLAPKIDLNLFLLLSKNARDTHNFIRYIHLKSNQFMKKI